MEIYKYYKNTEEWENIHNSKLEFNERMKLFEEYAITKGIKVTLQEYFDDNNRDYYKKDYCYKCVGKPSNIGERLVYAEIEYDDSLNYCYVMRHRPEDLCESRTDWDDMKTYADGLAYFIEDIKDAIANGEIIFKD